MFEYLKRLRRRVAAGDSEAGKPGESKPRNAPNKPAPKTAAPAEGRPVQKMTQSLEQNIKAMKSLFCEDNDFIVREFDMTLSGGIKAALFFIDGLVNGEVISETILMPLMIEGHKYKHYNTANIEAIADICSAFLPSGEIQTSDDLEKAATACLMGDTVLMVEGLSEFVFINTKGFEKRSVSEPQTENVVRGPREGFTEVLRVNTSLIRRRLKTQHLRLETMDIGVRTKTTVCLAYLDNIADPALIREVKKRLETIDTDAILNSGYIEEFIEDFPMSLFQTVNYTEKPDIIVGKLLEGRCALIIDGTPFVLTMPMLFVECFQTPEDYAMRPFIAIFLRLVRMSCFFVCLVGPAVYVALTSFHQELIPTALLYTIAASSESVPFNSFAETVIMLSIFEIIKEAGVRMPRPIGQAVSIVGALVMGQAATQAGLVGAPVVIVIALTGVSSFLAPILSDAITILRWYLLILAALMGGYGITLGLMTILIHLASLESFGSPYLYPFSPFNLTDMKDAILRVPLWMMKTRPAIIKPQDKVRQQAKKPEFEKGVDGD